MQKIIKLTLIGLLFWTSSHINAQSKPKDWAEIVLDTMSLEQKIAQLLMIRIHSNQNEKYHQKMIDSIAKYQVGGVCFFQGGPVRQVNLTNRIQAVSNIPLLVSIDGEWGVAMRLDSVPTFPRQMALGAITQNQSLLFEMGKAMGKQCRLLGIHVNFAPVVDINSNPNNPVINSRSFGGDKKNVSEKAALLMQGMQAEGIITCAKHFPGHGDTEIDSHKDLPAILKTRAELDTLELYPFKTMISKGVDWIMVGHLWLPEIDRNANFPATLSYNIITKLLREELGFKGIICTDAMDMKGLTKYAQAGEAEVKALLAGVDILLLPGEVEIVMQTIQNAIDSNFIPVELINEKCLKILKEKQRLGLTEFKPIATDNLIRNLNAPETENLIQKLTDQTITVLKNENSFPITSFKDSIALLTIGIDKASEFQKRLATLKNIRFFYAKSDIDSVKRKELINTLLNYPKIIVSLQGTTQSATANYNVKPETILLLDSLSVQKPISLCIFGNSYILNLIENWNPYKGIVMAYQPTKYAYNAVADYCLDKLKPTGKLPVKTTHFPPEKSDTIPTISAGVSLFPKSHTRIIDSLVHYGIEQNAFPGCQIVVVKDGKTLFRKSYGTLTYEDTVSVDFETVYDVASLTKTNATTLAVMTLYEEGKIKLKDKLSAYLPDLKGTDKERITIEEVLTHCSGLPAFYPFQNLYLNEDKTHKPDAFSETCDSIYTVKIAHKLYGKAGYKEDIIQEIINSKMGEKTYRYSDFGMILLRFLIEKITQEPFENYVKTRFYQPLKLQYTGFNPEQNSLICKIAPTENDTLFRKQVVCGTVHDPTAALLGGVSGHAGLFSTADEVAVIYQMLLNGGTYRGHQFFKPETVKLFTNIYPIKGNKRRGLGFDGPSPDNSEKLVPAAAGNRTFGHSGFTGAVVWADSENQLIYVFISNRIYPNAEPSILLKLGLRGKIHEEIYRAIK